MQYINGYICRCLALFFILVFIRLPEYHILQFHSFFFPRPYSFLPEAALCFRLRPTPPILFCQDLSASLIFLPRLAILLFLPELTSYFVAKVADSFYSRCKLHTARQAAIIFHTTLVAHCISPVINLYHNFITSRHSFLA